MFREGVLCVEIDAENFVVVGGAEGGSLDVKVELFLVFVGVWSEKSDLGFAWIDFEFVLCCPGVYLF